MTRLQEILRPLHTHESTGRALTDERDAKKARRALSPQCMPFAADFQVVDVFSERIYGGNPTCVCFVPSVSDVSVESLGRAAREMRQPTTSFVDAASGEYRTFGANGLELPYLSAHSTLGVGAALMARSGLAEHRLHGKGGPVTVRRAGKCFELALVQPTEPLVQPTELAPLAHALGIDRTTAIAHGLLPFALQWTSTRRWVSLSPQLSSLISHPTCQPNSRRRRRGGHRTPCHAPWHSPLYCVPSPSKSLPEAPTFDLTRCAARRSLLLRGAAAGRLLADQARPWRDRSAAVRGADRGERGARGAAGRLHARVPHGHRWPLERDSLGCHLLGRHTRRGHG